ncbi:MULTISPECIES: pyridoxal 5'-phosphate synthase glutaminase subunit PdxT [Archaeoglobus]|jgi:5'-phosphate synthase pdxT subunit|uniref:Pyridoxal 5'-phosphate synthase subunit PdxT n=3 Tax=Archaeoglobus fulgidus TaxID=2234 RepID=PDXT_ARCFU|nr:MULTISPECIES: pyridoxal 5'-phosphate synthase glutaminase subunit PdxT [Archaeoglobus]O29741.1 RecName: Full=Pyridoxal 5'-phosphate synthase subunit PdxT; AltName: Full=Pdx2; AltName: Full=Pyridoxal 5'-phosphate synthase glutaminase subunit [Archaeoglobus fulgidus DSM 4304]AAB90721.1 imidazoleglycerol-phosphate synthase, subunit H, putative [Archaeoglobus fulgidus DSM 4304]AIG97327.1 pyridoxal 5'-phosphate synthase, glutaminase subunit Pdx2 [Archaeoglobus fulgidus DSM 8774]KUJ93599.1 MAG: Gl
MKVAVVGVQGDVEEHVLATKRALKRLGIDGEVVATRRRGVVSRSDAVILPGGESTTISKLIFSDGIADEILQLAEEGKPVMGTCAGLILLSKYGDEQVEKTNTKLLGLLDAKVKRNAFGRQRESFQVPLDVKYVGKFDAVFIRAPAITEVGKDVEVLATFENLIVAARQKNVLGLAFHPELTDDTRIHEFFLKLGETS